MSLVEDINYKFWNIVVVIREQKILLIDRNKGDFDGFVPPGGKVEFPETFTESAIRELKEETGLTAKTIQQRGLSGFINEEKREQYIYVDFLCTDFDGELIEKGPEGNCSWVSIKDISSIHMQKDIKLRILEMLKNNIYEYQMYWDEEKKGVGSDDLDSQSFLAIKSFG